jgi:Family of unknown function (DUF6328)
MPDAPDDLGRHETEEERADRNLTDLIQELRVAGLGVQVLFGSCCPCRSRPGSRNSTASNGRSTSLAAYCPHYRLPWVWWAPNGGRGWWVPVAARGGPEMNAFVRRTLLRAERFENRCAH